jgi:hypothetical protein
MKHLSFPLIGLLLSGCVVHQVPMATPVSTAAPAAEATQNCRDFEDTVTVGGTQQRAHGTTCQEADGSWHIVAPATANPPAAVATAPVAVPAYPVYPTYPYYYPYYGYPAYYGPAYYGPAVGVGIGFRFGGHWH